MAGTEMTRDEWIVGIEGQVATLKWGPVTRPHDEYREHHISLAMALEEVRFDDRVRVIVIAGADDGAFETDPPPHELDFDLVMDPKKVDKRWSYQRGIERTFEVLALMEKPVIGRVKGDAYGFAGNVLYGCDLIVAAEDVIICDFHLTMDPCLSSGMSAGDGALAFLPLFVTPTKLKEMLFLGRKWTARQLADMQIINYAVPRDQVDGIVAEIVADLLKRPARALARTKRATNKALIQQWNLAMDYSVLAERLDIMEMPSRGWKPDLTFNPEKPIWEEVWDFDFRKPEPSTT